MDFRWAALVTLALAACGGRIDDDVQVDAGADTQYGSFVHTCSHCPDPSTVTVRQFCKEPDYNGCTCPSADPPPTCGGPIACTCLDEVWACRANEDAAWSFVYASACDQ